MAEAGIWSLIFDALLSRRLAGALVVFRWQPRHCLECCSSHLLQTAQNSLVSLSPLSSGFSPADGVVFILTRGSRLD